MCHYTHVIDEDTEADKGSLGHLSLATELVRKADRIPQSLCLSPHTTQPRVQIRTPQGMKRQAREAVPAQGTECAGMSPITVLRAPVAGPLGQNVLRG